MKIPSTSATGTRITTGSVTSLLVVLLLGAIAIAVAVGALVAHTFRTSSDCVDLRPALLESLDVSRNVEVSVSVPGWALTLGRVGISFADVPPEVEAGLDAVHSGRVGVYELAEIPDDARRMRLLETADAELLENGKWSRVVTVLEDQNLVAVYVMTDGLDHGKTADFFLIVQDQCELVIVSGRAYTEPAITLATAAMNQGLSDIHPLWSPH